MFAGRDPEKLRLNRADEFGMRMDETGVHPTISELKSGARLDNRIWSLFVAS